ncbi:MAG: transcription-repair coupling factor [Clostridia bacterium]|nr:transcription-repair coupling factor [Clostridia bacterium]
MQSPLLRFFSAPSLDALEKAASQKTTIALTGLPDGQAAFVASWLAEKTGKRILVISQNDLKAGRTAEDSSALASLPTAFLPGGEIDLTRGVSSQETAWRRLETLSRLMRDNVAVLSTSMDAMMQRMGSPALFAKDTVTLSIDDRYDPQALITHLVHTGYERVGLVEGKGQCALRGSVLDVYPPSESSAVRIEFFDDIVDSIRSFDAMTQRSLERINSCVLPPACEIVLDAATSPQAAARMREALGAIQSDNEESQAPLLFDDLPPLPDDDDELPSFFDNEVAPKIQEKNWSVTQATELERRKSALLSDADLVASAIPFRRIRAWTPVLLDTVYTVTDWFQPDLVLLCEPDGLRDRCKERAAGFSETLSNAMERGEAVQEQSDLYLPWDTISEKLSDLTRILVSDLTRGTGGIQPKEVIRMEQLVLTGYNSQIRTLASDIRKWRADGLSVILLSGGSARGRRLVSSLQELEVDSVFLDLEDVSAIDPDRITILPVTISHGFLFREAGCVVVSDTDIYGASYHRSRSRARAGEKIASFTELNPGDLVVHVDHGVGIFQGTIQMNSDGAKHEYLLIQYQGHDKLYVPVEQLSRVQRYIGNPSAPPKLNSIGGRDWSKQKSKVKESLRKMAFSLAELYAKRSQNNGHAFPPDTVWQSEFNDQFPYELTPDQAQSVREINEDMESSHNMDRLLCGDVGYGKTEVSLRAAFKCVMDNHQVAMLAPTTILVQQHYNTIVKRFSGFPVKIEYLSRFRSTKDVTRILKELEAGQIDIIVGTHRLLGKDVKFKNLGLLIVDEEQRFGVTHKEAIKNIKSQVDVLTLSATPIPRTLHMSMVGIRDMSVLQSPPADRIPVQTHVVEYSDVLIRDVILREVSRGGQVYFLYNRVQSIETFYERLHALVPEVRIGLAHGQMKANGLEDVMMDFYAGSYDVLLCTTIIESGLDVPTANTLIVFDAERFGLSQLYQLRGRVGRSSRQAYAYFTYRTNHLLSEAAQKRLSAIREFTEFGSGFRIAMRDLEIRGAGNILGPQQHGHLETIGYEMYCRLIEEAMREVQGETSTSDLETRVDLRVNAFLPNAYISDEHQRMEMYRRIAALSSDADREDIIDELIDRFGDMPDEVNTLLDVSQLRYLCNREGISQVSHKGDNLVMRLDSHFVKDPVMLLQGMRDTDARLAIVDRPVPAMVLRAPKMLDPELLSEGVKVMRVLNARMDELRKIQAEKEEKAKPPAEEPAC